jgi:LacI family transcriptional regulator
MDLETIAELSKVSRSTVSRVINNHPNVNPATRERVMEVIRKVNFQPNLAARGLAKGFTRILGLVIPMSVPTLFTDPYFPSFIQGVSAACNLHDHSVMLWLADPEYERRTIRQILYSGLIDGVIVASNLLDDPVVQALVEGNLPFILNGRHPSNDQVSYVDIDNIASAREAVLHLLRLGRQRIGTISGPHDMIAGADRLAGYSAALRDRGQVVNPELIVESDFTEAGGYHAMQRLIPRQPDAVFVASDTMAVGALRALHEAGLRLPEDVAIVGFDDMPFAARTDPPLTTIRQPIQRSGELATETLIDLIQHPQATTRRVILPTELVVRASCGAALN